MKTIRNSVIAVCALLMLLSCATTDYDMGPLGDFVMERVEHDGRDWYFLASANQTTHSLLQVDLPVVIHDGREDTWRIGMYYRPYIIAGNLTEEDMDRWIYDSWICGSDGSELVLGGKSYGGMRDFSRDDLETLLHIVSNPEGEYWFESRRNGKSVISRIMDSVSDNRSDVYKTDSWHAEYTRLIINWFLEHGEEAPVRSNSERLQCMRDARDAFSYMLDRRWNGKVAFYIADYILLGYRP